MLTRLEKAHAEFDQLAREILESLEQDRIASLERSKSMREVTQEAIAACDRLLEGLNRD